MLITSTDNKKIKEIVKLKQKKYRNIENKFIIETENLIEEAYLENRLEEVYILENENISLKLDCPIYEVTSKVMDKIKSVNTSKILGIATKKENLEYIGKRYLMLDKVSDPGNLGTIIRSAVAFNIDTIILSKNTVDLYNSKVLRSTQGMIFNINIVVSDLEKEIKELKNKNYKILTTKVDGGKLIKNIEKKEKFVIIIGNEGNGVSEQLQQLSDEYIYIKMNEKCESLNAAVATSIILYELSR